MGGTFEDLQDSDERGVSVFTYMRKRWRKEVGCGRKSKRKREKSVCVCLRESVCAFMCRKQRQQDQR